MDELEILANSRDRAGERQGVAHVAQASALRALTWPLILSAVAVGLPLLFCVVFFPVLGKGHPPGIIFPLLYMYHVTPVVAPLGVLASAVASVRHPAVRSTALAFMVVFLVG